MLLIVFEFRIEFVLMVAMAQTESQSAMASFQSRSQAWRGAQRTSWIGLVVTVLAHVVVAAALVAYTPLRQLLPTPPLMVRFITPVPLPPPPELAKPDIKSPEKIPEVKVVKKIQLPKPEPLPLLLAKTDAPSPVSVAPQPEPPKVAPPIEAPPAPSALPAPPAPPMPAQPKQVSEVEYVRAPQPSYPVLSRRAGEQGKVILRVLINPQGVPEEAQIRTSSGFPKLDEAARRAALGAAFRPYREGGQPIPVWTLIPINFSLEG